MKRSLLFLIIFINIAATTFSQILPSFVRFDSPSFVTVNERFTSSLIFKLDILTDESVLIRFQKPKSIKIVSVNFKSIYGDKDISFTTSEDNEDEINLMLNAEEYALDANYPYQLLLTCIAEEQPKLDKKLFSWKDKKDSNVTIENQLDKQNGISEFIDFYKPQRTAGKSIQLIQYSQLKINLSQETELNNIYTEFWLKTSNSIKNFLIITKTETKDTLVAISKNKFGFVTFPIKSDEIVRKDNYLGESNWNYVGILITKRNSDYVSEVYVNSELVYSELIENSFDLQKLGINFYNNKKTAIEIDRLKIWEFGNSINLADHNKHFQSYEADSSSIIYESNFDNSSEFSSSYNSQNLQIYNQQLVFKKSDAPIFSKAPKLTVSIGNSYNSFVWYVQEYSFAKEFEIERAIDGRGYETVYTTFADDDPLKIYYFTDELLNANEAAYYRVKQINKDGSSVYSMEVKVGNKGVKEFNLSQNYPNPFNPLTNIYVDVIVPAEFKVKVYDLVGNIVGDLHDGYLAEGMHTFEFDGSKLPSGIYFYEVISPQGQTVKKMILAK